MPWAEVPHPALRTSVPRADCQQRKPHLKSRARHWDSRWWQRAVCRHAAHTSVQDGGGGPCAETLHTPQYKMVAAGRVQTRCTHLSTRWWRRAVCRDALHPDLDLGQEQHSCSPLPTNEIPTKQPRPPPVGRAFALSSHVFDL